MKSSPTISVLMPVYNTERYVAKAVDSVLSQTFTDFEFLIVDDGSTDNTLKILQEYASRDARIHLTSRENWGLTKSLNELLTHARGEFVARLDADDIALPQRFEKQVQFLQEHPDVVCVGSALDWIDDRGQFIAHCPMPEENDELQRLMLGGISLLHHPCAMIRRVALNQVGGYDETLPYAEDLDLWLRLGEIGNLANLKESLVLYRLHSQSLSHTRQDRLSSDALEACQRAWQRRGIQGEFIRQSEDHLVTYDFWLQRGWEGLAGGRRDAARRCGQRAIALKPWGRSGWKLLLASLIHPFPGSKLV